MRFLLIAALCLFGSLPAKADVLTIHAGQSMTVIIDGPYDTSPLRFYSPLDGDFGVIALSPFITENHLPSPPPYDFSNPQVVGYRLRLTATGYYSIPYITEYGACNVGGTCGGLPTSSNSPQILSEEHNTFSFGLYLFPSGNYLFDPNDITATVTLPDGYHVRGVAAVPEPATWLMMLLGFAALGGLLQLKHAKRAVEVDRKILA